jgi:hypothetical protein
MTNARGLQMWGKVQIITKKNDPEEFEKGLITIRLDEISRSLNKKPFPEEKKQDLTIVKVVPHKISYFISMGEKPAKYIWHTNTTDNKNFSQGPTGENR